MMRVLAIPIILFPIFLTITHAEAGCTTTRFVNQTFTNCDNGFSAAGQKFGGTSSYSFSDGTSGVTQSFGNLPCNRFRDGTTCIGPSLRPTRLLNCDGGPEDGVKQGIIVGAE